MAEQKQAKQVNKSILVTPNALQNREKGFIYFIGKDNGIYKMKVTWQTAKKKA